MNNKININQVEQVTGVSKRNIRFYEKEGLVVPERNAKEFTNALFEFAENEKNN